MIEVSEGLTICPFNAPIIKGKNKEEIEKYVRSGFGDAEFLRADDGSPMGLCVLEQAKPTICRAFPLGRAGKAEKSKDRFPKMRYIRVDSKRCDEFKKPGSAITVREYIRKWDLDRAYEMSDKVYELYRLLGDKVKSEAERYFLGIMFYNFDIPFLEHGREPRKIRVARPAEFEEVLELVKSVIEEHKTP
jgi:Fe-S-cluster containining protein